MTNRIPGSLLALALVLTAASMLDVRSEESQSPSAALSGAGEGNKDERSESKDSKQDPLAPIKSDMEALVRDFYPKAKFEAAGDKIHFEHKVKVVMGAYSGKREKAPDLDGIMGDVTVKSGKYTGSETLPLETNNMLYVRLLMAPYNQPTDSHLHVSLLFPPNVPLEFKEQFKKLISKYASESTVKTASSSSPSIEKTSNQDAQPNSPVINEPSGGAAGAIASTSGVANVSAAATLGGTKTDFGSSKLSKYAYPEGRFRILLPGNPQMKFSTQLGMREVEYIYPEPQGAYNVSYLIMPGQVRPGTETLFLDKLTGALATKLGAGSQPRCSATSLQGFPGRILDFPAIKGEPGASGRIKIFLVRRFVYIVGAAGKKAWLESPAVAEVINSLSVTPEPTAAEKAAEAAKEAQRKRDAYTASFSKQRSDFDRSFNEQRSRNRKDFEKSRADFESRRNRPW